MLNDLRSTAKHSFVYAFGNAATKLVGLILIPIYTNSKFLPVDDFGVLGILEITSMILVAFFGLSIYQGFNRWYWEEDTVHYRKSLFFTTFIFVLITSVIAGGAMLPFSSYFSQILFEHSDYNFLFQIMIANSILLALQNVTLSLLRLESKSVLFTALNLSKLIISLLLTIYFVVFRKMGLEGIYLPQLISSIAYFIIGGKFFISFMVPNFRRKVIKEFINYSAPLMFASISGTILVAVDRYSLNFLSKSALVGVAIYGLAFKFSNTIKLFVATSIQQAYTPIKIQKMNQEGNQHFYAKINTYFAFIIMIFVVIMSLFASEIVEITSVDPEYIKAIPLIPVLSFVVFFSMLKDNVMVGLQLTKKTSIIGILTVLVTFLNIILNRVLIPYFDLYGAAAATLVSQIIFYCAIYYSSQRNYRIPYENGKIFILTIVSIFFIAGGLASDSMSLLMRLILKTGLMVGFPIILFKTGFFDEKEKNIISSTLKAWKSPRAFMQSLKRMAETK